MVYFDPSEDMESYAWSPAIYELESPGAANVRARSRSNGIDTSPLTLPFTGTAPGIVDPLFGLTPSPSQGLPMPFSSPSNGQALSLGGISGIVNWLISNPLLLLLALPLITKFIGRGKIGSIINNPLMLLLILPMVGIDLFGTQSKPGTSAINTAFGGIGTPVTAQNMMLWGLLPKMGTMATMMLGGLAGIMGNQLFKPKRSRRRSYRRAPARRYYPRRRYSYRRRY